MAATDRTALVRKIIGDTAKFVLAGMAVALGQMIIHEGGSNVFGLRWDATKFGFSLLGSLLAATLVGIIRWRMWSRSHPEAVD